MPHKYIFIRKYILGLFAYETDCAKWHQQCIILEYFYFYLLIATK